MEGKNKKKSMLMYILMAQLQSQNLSSPHNLIEHMQPPMKIKAHVYTCSSWSTYTDLLVVLKLYSSTHYHAANQLGQLIQTLGPCSFHQGAVTWLHTQSELLLSNDHMIKKVHAQQCLELCMTSETLQESAVITLALGDR